MNRETKTVTTPSGNVIVLHTYITGRERRALTNVFFDKNLDEAGQYNLAQDMSFRFMLVSIDGKKEGDVIDGKKFSIADAVLDMKNVDSKFIVKEVNEASSDKATEEKKV